MKKHLVIILWLGIAVIAPSCFAQSVPSVQETTKQIIRSVKWYASAIACNVSEVSPKDIAALVPYKTADDRENAKYAVLWHGDIGCLGGSGTSTTNIAIVTVSTGDSFVVDPLRSSPVIEFESVLSRDFARLVGNTGDSLVLDGKEYDEKDAMCCPSLPVRITVRVDAGGNWKVIDKKAIPSKKKN